jgi:FKBP-type peptidyl-prolyl cis-trans isomerase FkpA
MKVFYIGLFFLSAIFTSCLKEDTACSNVNPASEDTTMIGYASRNGHTMTKHSSGMYYQIINPGTGATPTINSKLRVRYNGLRMDGSRFDGGDNLNASNPWTLSSLIQGWQIGIPLIKKGGTIRLIIPSALAYGCNGNSGIAPNSVLYFEVELLEVI